MLHHVVLARADVSEKRSAFIIRVTKIGKLGTVLAVTSNWRTCATRRNIPEDGILLNVNAYGGVEVSGHCSRPRQCSGEWSALRFRNLWRFFWNHKPKFSKKYLCRRCHFNGLKIFYAMTGNTPLFCGTRSFITVFTKVSRPLLTKEGFRAVGTSSHQFCKNHYSLVSCFHAENFQNTTQRCSYPITTL
jgi:hypothetical protein